VRLIDSRPRGWLIAVGVAATLAMATALALPACESMYGTTRAGFWFDRVTFPLPSGQVARLGGQLTAQDIETIQAMALSELRQAYAEYRIEFSPDPDVLYSVRVVNEVLRYGGAGQSIALGALGGRGTVSYPVIVGIAMRYAPPEADRRTILDGIGRGIGRAAAHEFAHQLVPRANIHSSRDPDSYEFSSADRAAECYGPIHWDIAKPALARALGVRGYSFRTDSTTIPTN
jgi:hypothetical protein